MSLSSSHIVIRDVGVVESSTGSVVMRNLDSEPVTVQHVVVDNGRFQVNPVSGVIQPSDSLLVTITFTPSVAGEERTLVKITLDDWEITVSVTGNPPLEPVRVPVRLVTRNGHDFR